jgi:hypothetical protein
MDGALVGVGWFILAPTQLFTIISNASEQQTNNRVHIANPILFNNLII